MKMLAIMIGLVAGIGSASSHFLLKEDRSVSAGSGTGSGSGSGSGSGKKGGKKGGKGGEPSPEEIWDACSGEDDKIEQAELEDCMRPHLQGMGMGGPDKIGAVAHCLVHSYGDKDGVITKEEFEAEFGTHFEDCFHEVMGTDEGRHDDDHVQGCGDHEVFCYDDEGNESCAPADTGCPCKTDEVKCIEEPPCHEDSPPEMCQQYSFCVPSTWGCPPEELHCKDDEDHCYVPPAGSAECEVTGSPACWGMQECVAGGTPCPCPADETQCIEPANEDACNAWGEDDPSWCEPWAYCEPNPPCPQDDSWTLAQSKHKNRKFPRTLLLHWKQGKQGKVHSKKK